MQQEVRKPINSNSQRKLTLYYYEDSIMLSKKSW